MPTYSEVSERGVMEEKMLKAKTIGICLGLSMLTVPGRAESLALAYRVAHGSSVLRRGGAYEKRSVSFKRDLGDLFLSATGGMRESFSGRSFLYFGLGASLVLVTYGQDERIQAFFQRNRPFGRASEIGDGSGNVINMGLPAVALYSVGRLSGNGELTEVGKVMLATNMVEWSLSLGLICAVRRQRPPAGHLHIFEGRYTSFPSGHVVGSFATATVLNEFYGPKVGIPAYLFASFVGLSRIEDNKHYASDVVGGAVLGTVTALAVSRATRTRWARISAAPVVDERRTGLAAAYHF